MLASERGHTDIVDALLSAGADVCSLDENGNSALHLACFYGNQNVVELLLAVDVDLTVCVFCVIGLLGLSFSRSVGSGVDAGITLLLFLICYLISLIIIMPYV